MTSMVAANNLSPSRGDGKKDEASDSSKPFPLPTWRHFASGGIAAATSSAIYNPLDSLRVKWQVLGASTGEQSIVTFGSRIIQEEGLFNGLWKPGIGANMIGMSLSGAIRLGSYETIRNSFGGEKKAWHIVSAGLLCGSLAYFTTTPFHLMKTKLQACPEGSRRNALMEMIKIVSKTRRLDSLWKGSVPVSTRGALFSAGHVTGYDGLKTLLKSRGVEDGPYLHAISSISASFWASVLSAPADFTMARYMNERNTDNLANCMLRIYHQEGILGFWRGWNLYCLRLTPVMLTYSAIYEQIRFHLGLGYLS